jgi:hypothetical protein
MRIKKYKKNEYILADGVWIRNPCSEAEALDINSLNKKEINLFLENETKNIKISSMHLDSLDQVNLDNLIIFSDGYMWEEKQFILGSLPSSLVKTIGVNGSLAKWKMVGEKAEIKRTMTFYLANNPYAECINYLPKKHSYYPNLIASTKTNNDFLKRYPSEPFFYKATNDLNYSGVGASDGYMKLDDYRNPICAALSFAYKKKSKKIVLFCCDDSFKDERPGSVRMKNGLYQYPQQIMCQNIIDKQIFWLKKSGVEIFDCSFGMDYENAAYIKDDELLSFFEGYK